MIAPTKARRATADHPALPVIKDGIGRAQLTDDANRYRFIPAISSKTAQTAAVSCISRPCAAPA